MQLFLLGSDINNQQYRELFDLYINLHLRPDLNPTTFDLLCAIMAHFEDMQEKLLDRALQLGVQIARLHSTESMFIEFSQLCAKIDVFRTKSENRTVSVPHIEDSEKFVLLQRLRQGILLRRKRESRFRHFFYWLFSCFRTPDSRPVLDASSVPFASFEEPFSISSEGQQIHSIEQQESVHNTGNALQGSVHITRNGQPESSHTTEILSVYSPSIDSESEDSRSLTDYQINRDDSSGHVNLFLSTLDLAALGLLPFLGQDPTRRALLEALGLSNDLLDILPQTLLNSSPQATMRLSDYSDEDCEQFLQLLEKIEPVLNLDLYNIQGFVEKSGLLTPSQIRGWREQYHRFLTKTKDLHINHSILMKIMSILKKRQKTQDEKAIEHAFMSRGQQASKYLAEMAMIERSAEIKRRLPSCWQTYCDICISPFRSGEGLSPLELLEFKPERKGKGKHSQALSWQETEQDLNALEEPESTDESIERKAAILPSALEECEQTVDDELPKEIVFCGSCGYRVCRACIEKVKRHSACRCPTCAEVLMVPTMSTLRAFCKP